MSEFYGWSRDLRIQNVGKNLELSQCDLVTSKVDPNFTIQGLFFLLRGCKEEEEGKIISFSKAEQKRDSDTVATNPT